MLFLNSLPLPIVLMLVVLHVMVPLLEVLMVWVLLLMLKLDSTKFVVLPLEVKLLVLLNTGLRTFGVFMLLLPISIQEKVQFAQPTQVLQLFQLGTQLQVVKSAPKLLQDQVLMVQPLSPQECGA